MKISCALPIGITICLVVLSLCQGSTAVCLKEKTDPLLHNAVAVARRSSGIPHSNGRDLQFHVDITTAIMEQIIASAQEMIQQIQLVLTEGQTTANALIAQLQALAQEIRSQKSSTAGLISLKSVLDDFQSAPGRNSPLTQTIVDLINQFNVEHQITGTLSSSVVQIVAGMINNLGFSPMVQSAITALLGEDLANFVFDQLTADRRLRIPVSAGKELSEITGIVEQMTQALTPAFQQLQSAVMQVVKEVLEEIYTNAVPVIHDLLDALQAHLPPNNGDRVQEEIVQRLANVF